MPLEVIGAGFGRTGTDSLKMGLLKLGYGDCYHMTEVPGKPGHEVLWLEAAEGNPDWERLFKGCKAAVDFPASSFYEELAAQYPDAKVIVSTRDFEKWCVHS
ncbi:hypothetical protein CYMTET_33468 [Cymbomonas tetramitiformis]|uniref:Sulfotransferase family protein n=1 Tax=Cymbomonas tetramitiformis TaxID=36881 RepID=A0AAE0FD66_9CHLO|nr:hypothetical protein CYMTET_33468 [Cymbomonas tetramitiformis]